MLVRFAKGTQPVSTKSGGVFLLGRTILGTQVRIFGEGDRPQREEYLADLAETVAEGGVWDVRGIAPGTHVVVGENGQTQEHFKAWAIDLTAAGSAAVREREAELEAMNLEADSSAFRRQVTQGPKVANLPQLAELGRQAASQRPARALK